MPAPVTADGEIRAIRRITKWARNSRGSQQRLIRECRAGGARPAGTSLEQRFNVRDQGLGLGHRRKAFDLTIGADQEFGEVPLDALTPEQARRPALKLCKQRI